MLSKVCCIVWCILVGWGINFSPLCVGQTDYQRVGDELEWTSLEIRFNLRGPIFIPQATPADDPPFGSTNVVRVVIFQWHVTNAASSPAANDILNNNAVFVGDRTIAPYQVNQRDRYTILWDRTYSFHTQGENGVAESFMLYPGRQGGGKRKIQYESASTIIGVEQIYFMVMSNAGVTPYPQIDLCSQLNFIDT